MPREDLAGYQVAHHDDKVPETPLPLSQQGMQEMSTSVQYGRSKQQASSMLQQPTSSMLQQPTSSMLLALFDRCHLASSVSALVEVL